MNNLQKRFLKFAKDTVVFAKTVEPTFVNRPLVVQLIRSATSIGANYTEAQSGLRRKIFELRFLSPKKRLKKQFTGVMYYQQP